MKISDIILVLEEVAPRSLQEEYDNCGLLVGSADVECTGVLLTVDVTPAVVREAIDSGLNLIVAHHPLIFRGLKSLTGKSAVERSVIMAIRGGISIYACHTCLDNAADGVSKRMALMLGMKNVAVLDPQKGKSLKLSVFVPTAHADLLSKALFEAGAGVAGNYDFCCYMSDGRGSFRALDGADPFVGKIGEVHVEQETRLEVILPVWKRTAVEAALLSAHPYETPAYEFVAVENYSETGSGAIGELPEAITALELVERVKAVFASPVARCSSFPMDRNVTKVAMCGGSGAFLIGKAIAGGAQAFITSDTKYHDFVDYADRILIIDIGHHESENCTKDIFYHVIREKFPIFAVRYSQSDINPIKYL